MHPKKGNLIMIYLFVIFLTFFFPGLNAMEERANKFDEEFVITEETALHKAVRETDLKAINEATYKLFSALRSRGTKSTLKDIESAIEGGADVNKCIDNEIPLSIAIREDDVAAVQLLIERGARVNGVYTVKGTPLQRAIVQRNIECVRLLIEHGADVNARYDRQETPLFRAAILDVRGFRDSDQLGLRMVMLLIENGALIPENRYARQTVLSNLQKKFDQYPLVKTILSLDRIKASEIIRSIRDDPRNPQWDEEDINYSLPIAAALKEDALVSNLLKLEDIKEHTIESVVTIAARNRDFSYFIDLYSDVEKQWGYNSIRKMQLHHISERILKWAFSQDRQDIVMYVLEKHAREATTRLFDSLLSPTESTLKDIESAIEDGADVNECRGKTPLEIAIERSNVAAVQLLIKAGALVNAVGLETTPLNQAVYENKGTDCAKLLIEHGADVNALNAQRRTPLFTAAIGYHTLDMVLMLIKNGARIMVKGQTEQLLSYLQEKYRTYPLAKAILSADGAEIDRILLSLSELPPSTIVGLLKFSLLFAAALEQDLLVERLLSQLGNLVGLDEIENIVTIAANNRCFPYFKDLLTNVLTVLKERKIAVGPLLLGKVLNHAAVRGREEIVLLILGRIFLSNRGDLPLLAQAGTSINSLIRQPVESQPEPLTRMQRNFLDLLNIRLAAGKIDKTEGDNNSVIRSLGKLLPFLPTELLVHILSFILASSEKTAVTH